MIDDELLVKMLTKTCLSYASAIPSYSVSTLEISKLLCTECTLGVTSLSIIYKYTFISIFRVTSQASFIQLLYYIIKDKKVTY